MRKRVPHPLRFTHAPLLALTVLFTLLPCSHPQILAQQKRVSDEKVAREVGIRIRELKELRIREGVTNADILKMPERMLRELRLRIFRPDLPDAAAAFRDLRAFGTARESLTADALWKAVVSQEVLRSTAVPPVGLGEVAGLPFGVGPVLPCMRVSVLAPDACKWSSLGPTNVGGRARSVVASPDGRRVWLGSLGGGIWLSENGGESFRLVDGAMANFVVSTLVVNPRNPDELYAGTGEGFFNNENVNRGAGIFRTADGERWSLIPSTGPANPDFLYVNHLAISRDGEVLLAATQTGVMRSERATRDDWSRRLDGKIADVEFDPSDASRAVASGLKDGSAYFSTNGGRDWKPAAHAETWTGRVELTYAAADPSIVYASVYRKVDKVLLSEIWRSVDRGQSYRAMPTLIAGTTERAHYLGSNGQHANLIWAGHPSNPNFLILGGIDLWRSDDGGATLRPISNRRERESLHVDQHCLAPAASFDGDKNKAVFICNDGGLERTPDITTAGLDPQHVFGWEKVRGLNITQFHGGAGDPATGVVIGGVMDNGTQRFDPAAGINAWVETNVPNGGGDGGACAFDPANKIFYGETQYLGLFRSTDGGLTSEHIDGVYFNATNEWVRKKEPYNIPDAGSDKRVNYVAPFILDPNDPDRLLAGGLSLWRTNEARTPNVPYKADSGPRWFEIKKPTGELREHLISAIAVTPGNSNVVWVGHNDGSVYVTSNALDDSPVWNRLDDNGPAHLPDGGVCTKIIVGRERPNVVHVVFGGFRAGNVWTTTDGGSNWQRLDPSNTLPPSPVYDLAVHPTHPDFLYVSTAVGVLASEDGGRTWLPTSQGPTNCSVQDLFWAGTTLIAVTHGRGMFAIDLTF